MMKTLCFILPLIATIEYCNTENGTASFYDEMTCANCSGVNEKCNVTTTGWSCDHAFDAKKLIDNGNSSNIPKNLSTCMLPDMEFVVEASLFGFCCIWSPEIGCQKLKKDNNLEDHCYRCTRAIYSSHITYSSCPCGEFVEHSVARRVMPKPWHFLCITFIIILNLQILKNKH